MPLEPKPSRPPTRRPSPRVESVGAFQAHAPSRAVIEHGRHAGRLSLSTHVATIPIVIPSLPNVVQGGVPSVTVTELAPKAGRLPFLPREPGLQALLGTEARRLGLLARHATRLELPEKRGLPIHPYRDTSVAPWPIRRLAMALRLRTRGRRRVRRALVADGPPDRTLCSLPIGAHTRTTAIGLIGAAPASDAGASSASASAPTLDAHGSHSCATPPLADTPPRPASRALHMHMLPPRRRRRAWAARRPAHPLNARSYHPNCTVSP